MDFYGTLKWIVTGGAILFASWVSSWGLEEIPWFQMLKPKIKQLIVLVIALLIGIGAQYLLSLPAEQFEQLKPYGQVIVLTGSAWLAMQGFHFKNPSRG